MTPPPAAELDWPRDVLAWLSGLPPVVRSTGGTTLVMLQTYLRERRYDMVVQKLNDLTERCLGAFLLAAYLNADEAYEACSDAVTQALDLRDAYYDWRNAQERAAIRDGGPLEHLRDNRDNDGDVTP
jgi:hypothetical protein